MKQLTLLLFIALFLSSCAPAAIVTSTPMPMQAIAPTSPQPPTPTPTPKIYTLRIVFSTSADWSKLLISNWAPILGVHLVDKQGNLIDYSVTKSSLQINQTLEDAQALKRVSITVDFDVDGMTPQSSLSFILEKGAINSSEVRFYNVLNGSAYSLLKEISRSGAVTIGNADTNQFIFSFDLKPLFHDVAALATLTQADAKTGKFIFEYYKAAYQKLFPDLKGDVNIFISNWDGTTLTPLTNGLNNLNHIESVSPDGQLTLISSRSNYFADGDLYLVRLNPVNSQPVKLAKGLTGFGQATFLNNSQISFIGQGSKGYGFYVVNIDGTNLKKIGAPTGEAWAIVSSDKTRIYWRTIQQENFKDSSGTLVTYGGFATLWWTNIDGSGQGKLESNGTQIIPGFIFAGDEFAFSTDHTRIAWIPAGPEPGCSILQFVSTPFIRDGTATNYAAKPSMFNPKNSPHFGKTIDINYVENYVRRCLVLHIASLSNMDNDIKIPLIPPFDPTIDDFNYHSSYSLKWWPDDSKILLYDGGATMQYFDNQDRVPIALYDVNPSDADPKMALLTILSDSPVVQPGGGGLSHLEEGFTSFDFSPDGRQIIFAQYSTGQSASYSTDQSMIKILNLETMSYADDLSRNITPDTQEQRVGNIYWLP